MKTTLEFVIAYLQECCCTTKVAYSSGTCDDV